MYVIDTTYFDEYFLFLVITRRQYFLYKVIVIQRFGDLSSATMCQSREIQSPNQNHVFKDVLILNLIVLYFE